MGMQRYLSHIMTAVWFVAIVCAFLFIPFIVWIGFIIGFGVGIIVMVLPSTSSLIIAIAELIGFKMNTAVKEYVDEKTKKK